MREILISIFAILYNKRRCTPSQCGFRKYSDLLPTRKQLLELLRARPPPILANLKGLGVFHRFARLFTVNLHQQAPCLVRLAALAVLPAAFEPSFAAGGVAFGGD